MNAATTATNYPCYGVFCKEVLGWFLVFWGVLGFVVVVLVWGFSVCFFFFFVVLTFPQHVCQTQHSLHSRKQNWLRVCEILKDSVTY